ncbi:hypothetical protein SSX86_016459 [Deinandra increscens subsp. villosa]|uniref:Pectinesterase n=1 Tax=Deinandra increscens subsp. villosa TaxID=3103831 RepID=A0AAP0CZP9_9ASTR
MNDVDRTARRRTRKRITVIGISSAVLVLIVVSAVVGSSQSNEGRHNDGESQSHSSIKAICDATLYPGTCYASISPLVNSTNNMQPHELLKLTVLVTIRELSKASMLMELKNCSELLDLALDHLNDSLSKTTDAGLKSTKLDDVITWLSAAGTYQQTCLDNIQDNFVGYLKKSAELTSNSLAVANGFSRIANSYNQRRLMSLAAENDEMPEWLLGKDRKLLQNTTTLPAGIKADVVVAQDGSGMYKKISDALNAVPEKSQKRFVIYVKKGIYFENVRIEKSKWAVMMVGEGMDSTIVSGSLSVVDGTPTFSSATFAVFGKGFIARDMGFRNTAGAVKHQAVALMSTADQSVFYRCRIDAFQDSLYTHSNRQFYRECNIYGTVDFIFGNSAVVFQNCNILPRQPLTGQQNTITAQGKFDPNQNTGISIQSCTIWPYGNLSDVQTFLGRPWKNYSTTVFINNMMGSLIDPTGWLPWVGTAAPDTIFYAEFANYGPGAVTKNRVAWKGLKFITSKQASKFTVDSFINGDKWINGTGVAYKPGI